LCFSTVLELGNRNRRDRERECIVVAGGMSVPCVLLSLRQQFPADQLLQNKSGLIRKKQKAGMTDDELNFLSDQRWQ